MQNIYVSDVSSHSAASGEVIYRQLQNAFRQHYDVSRRAAREEYHFAGFGGFFIAKTKQRRLVRWHFFIAFITS
jgi:hypothetical protein